MLKYAIIAQIRRSIEGVDLQKFVLKAELAVVRLLLGLSASTVWKE